MMDTDASTQSAGSATIPTTTHQTHTGDPYGLYRVRDPVGTMPQSAWKVDATPICYDNEIVIDAHVLNIDSASFTQMKQAAEGNPERVAEIINDTIHNRGKMHNPLTGSGGMLVGTVRELGNKIAERGDLQVGDRVATLVSLSLTPLHLEKIHHIDMKNGQVDVTATAILFESGIYAKMPTDLPARVALAVFDVCGAPAQTARLVKEGDTVVILGCGGKSGLTVLRQARLSAGNGKVVAIEYGEEACHRVRKLGWADAVLNLDATKPADVYVSVRDALQELSSGTIETGASAADNQNADARLADVVINCVNVPGTEMSSILCAKDQGTVYFFSMATSFTACALGAEGVGKDVNMVIGNGYCHGHAEHALNLMRGSPELLSLFEQKFADV